MLVRAISGKELNSIDPERKIPRWIVTHFDALTEARRFYSGKLVLRNMHFGYVYDSDLALIPLEISAPTKKGTSMVKVITHTPPPVVTPPVTYDITGLSTLELWFIRWVVQNKVHMLGHTSRESSDYQILTRLLDTLPVIESEDVSDNTARENAFKK